MANVIEKADKLVRTNLGILERELAMARLVTRDMGGDFRGAANDTIKIAVDSIVTARTRALRATTDLNIDEFAETTVDVKLDTHVFRRTGVELAQLTLDIENYARQVSQPAVRSVARMIEDTLIAKMVGATYALDVGAINAADPWVTFVSAATALNKCNVDMGDRFLALGSDVYEALLKSDRIAKVDQSGSDDALRRASVGMVAGMMGVIVPGLAPKTAIAGHRSAFTLAVKAPAVPRGAEGGATAGYNGFALTEIFDYNDTKAMDVYGVHSFIGASIVEDAGAVNETTGIFTPAVVPETDDSDKILVRAVKMALA